MDTIMGIDLDFFRAASMAKYLSPEIDQYIKPSKFFNDLK